MVFFLQNTQDANGLNLEAISSEITHKYGHFAIFISNVKNTAAAFWWYFRCEDLHHLVYKGIEPLFAFNGFLTFQFDEPGSYKLLVEKGKEVIFWDFKIQPKDEQYATDIRRPIRTFADGKTSLASVTKICSNQTQTTNEEKSTIKTKSKRRLKKVKAATVSNFKAGE